MKRTKTFSWKGLVLAPLPVPLIFSALFEISIPDRSPILSFLFFFAMSSVLSYGTIFFLLPCLSLVSRFTPPTALLTCHLGTVLGGVVYLPIIWQSYLAGGDNSGPPPNSFGEYLRQHLFEGAIYGFIVAGLITAMLYWFLLNQPSRRKDQPQYEDV